MAQSLYDYYLVEDDLDIDVDDQLIDFSQRYSDLRCVNSSKLLGKKRPLSAISVNSEPTGSKQPCEDDLRVYCIEGTPLLISSSSSMCDLRDIGASDISASIKNLEEKRNFKLGESSEAIETQIKSIAEKDSTVVVENKKSDTKEGDASENIPVNEEFSEASSPLMFSRSSSVCSLNSFEQNSIVDDRSSVSVFSNLTSGLISPSDIPDSPGEALSPFVHINKQPVFKFPVGGSEKESCSVDTKVNVGETSVDSFDNLPEDDVKVFNVEGDCSSMSSFSELSIHTSSRMSVANSCDNNKFVNMEQKTSIQINYVSKTTLVKESCLSTLQAKKDNCFESSTSNVKSVISSESVKKSPDCIGFQSISSPTVERDNLDLVNSEKVLNVKTNIQDLDIVIKEEFPEKNLDSSDSLSESDEEADALLEECIRSGKVNESLHDNQEDEKNIPVSGNDENNIAESGNSLIESDDEAEALLEECIRNGKPGESTPSKEINKQTSNNLLINMQEELSTIKNSQNTYSDSYTIQRKNVSKNLFQSAKYQQQYDEERLKKIAKVSECSSPLVSKQKILNIQPNSKPKDAQSLGNKQTNHLYHSYPTHFNNSSQVKKCRFEQNKNSFYGMKPFRPLVHNRSANPVKKLQKEILIGLYRTLNEDRTEKKINETQCSDEDLLNQCIKLGMPDKKSINNFQSTRCSSKSNQVYIQSKAQESHFSRTNDLNVHCKRNQISSQLRADCLNSCPKCNCCPSITTEHMHSRKYQVPSQTCSQVAYHSSKSNFKYLKAHKKEDCYKTRDESADDENNILQNCIRLGMPTRACLSRKLKDSNRSLDKDMSYRDRKPDGISDVDDDDDDDDDILMEYINAGKPSSKSENKTVQEQTSPLNKWTNKKQTSQCRSWRDFCKFVSDNYMHNSIPSSLSKKTWAEPFNPDEDSVAIIEEAPCVYTTEDTPVLSPSASISDLSSLSFNDDKNSLRSNHNNSCNSNCSSDSDEDELLLQCIQSGMPSAKRAVA